MRPINKTNILDVAREKNVVGYKWNLPSLKENGT